MQSSNLPNNPVREKGASSSAPFWNFPCWAHQKVISHHAEMMKSLPGMTQRHVSHCSACRDFRAAECDLIERLVSDPKPRSHSPSPFLRARIMASVGSGALPRAQRPRLILVPIWAAALVIIGVGVFAIPFFRHPQDSTRLANEQPSVPKPSMRQFAGTLPENFNRHLFELSKTVNQPLEVEMQSVVTDAKAAVHLLAGNFLPGQ